VTAQAQKLKLQPLERQSAAALPVAEQMFAALQAVLLVPMPSPMQVRLGPERFAR
jgi:hypothetical protein